MRIFRSIVLLVFVTTAALYGYLYFYNKSRTDQTLPVISCADDVLDVSVTDDEKALLKGVTAYDEKDGDLTGRVIIEQISNFIQKGESYITYAVWDNDNHVVKTKRLIRYTDYEPPQFTFKKDMRFALGTNFNVLDVIGAKDKIDGDLTKKIKLTSSDLSVNQPGVYHIQAKVANSKGDVRYLDFNVTMYERVSNAPEIGLKEYLVYMKVGDPFIAGNYIDEKTRNEIELDKLSEKIDDSNMDPLQAGDYQIDYYVTDKNGITAKASLIVVVEE
jgi:hypothetical protein